MVTAALLCALSPAIPSQSCSEAQEGSQAGCTQHLPNCLNDFMSSIVVFVLKLNKQTKKDTSGAVCQEFTEIKNTLI